MLRAKDAPIPSTSSMSAVAARSTPCSPPKCFNNARRRAGPRPGMVSRIDSLKRRARRLRWPVIAKRCASSRTRWMSRNAGDSAGRVRGCCSPYTNSRSWPGTPVRTLGYSDQSDSSDTQFAQRAVNSIDLP